MIERGFTPVVAGVALWMCGALTGFCVLTVSLRALSARFSIFELLAVRSLFGLVIVASVALALAERRTVLVSARPVLHLVRNVVHLAATYLWSLGVIILPLATVFALEFTAPAWVALFAVLFLGERMTSSRVAAVVLGLLGVLVILRPGLESFQPATLVVLLSAMGLAISLVVQKRLTATDSTLCILFWMSAIQLSLCAAGVIATGDPGFPMKFRMSDAPAVIGLGLGGLAAHYCLTNAFRLGDAVIVVPLDFLRIPLIALVGFFVYAEPLDPLVFMGSGLIIAGILWNLVAEAAARRNEK
jgi:drug/metabolite transporter (DMT)-like permease